MAASSSASPSVSSEFKSLEIVSVCFLPGVLGFLGLAEFLPTSFSDLDDPDSQAVTAPRPNESAIEGMVYLDLADRVVGVRCLFALQGLFIWRYARQGV